ncbi:hypothetical protein LguiB_030446 [Lonicera macranthoides]
MYLRTLDLLYANPSRHVYWFVIAPLSRVCIWWWCLELDDLFGERTEMEVLSSETVLSKSSRQSTRACLSRLRNLGSFLRMEVTLEAEDLTSRTVKLTAAEIISGRDLE